MNGFAIAGIPGSGKTTLAGILHERQGWPVVSTGDIARRVDPDGLAAGGLADEGAFRAAWYDTLASLPYGGVVLFDGIPRSKGQVDLLPDGTKIIMLDCRPLTAERRLLARGRADDTFDIIGRRVAEQAALLEVQWSDGWLRRFAGAVINTETHDALATADLAAWYCRFWQRSHELATEKERF